MINTVLQAVILLLLLATLVYNILTYARLIYQRQEIDRLGRQVEIITDELQIQEQAHNITIRKPSGNA